MTIGGRYVARLIKDSAQMSFAHPSRNFTLGRLFDSLSITSRISEPTGRNCSEREIPYFSFFFLSRRNSAIIVERISAEENNEGEGEKCWPATAR